LDTHLLGATTIRGYQGNSDTPSALAPSLSSRLSTYKTVAGATGIELPH